MGPTRAVARKRCRRGPRRAPSSRSSSPETTGQGVSGLRSERVVEVPGDPVALLDPRGAAGRSRGPLRAPGSPGRVHVGPRSSRGGAESRDPTSREARCIAGSEQPESDPDRSGLPYDDPTKSDDPCLRTCGHFRTLLRRRLVDSSEKPASWRVRQHGTFRPARSRRSSCLLASPLVHVHPRRSRGLRRTPIRRQYVDRSDATSRDLSAMRAPSGLRSDPRGAGCPRSTRRNIRGDRVSQECARS